MAAPRDLTVRPLALPELVDRAVALTRRHFRPLFLAMLVAQAPALALARVQSGALAEVLGALGEPARAAERLAALTRTLGWLLLLLLVLQLAATAAAAAIVAPSLDPRPPPCSRARRGWAAASAALAHGAALAIAPAAGALPGLLLSWRAETLATAVAGVAAAAVGAIAALVLVVVRLVLAPVAAAVEGRAGLRALARSSALMAPRRGAPLLERPALRASLLLFATLLLALAVNGLAGLPRLVAARLAGDGGALALLGLGLPPAVELGLTLFEAAAAAALQPFSLVAVVVFYFDRRARREALDVELWAERLERA